MSTRTRRRSLAALFVALVSALLLSGCAGLAMFGDSVNRAFNGMPATAQFYAKDGHTMMTIQGTSLRVARDDRFDTTTDGMSNNDSSVLLISVGNSHVSHVGSTMVMAQDGLVKVSDKIPDGAFDITSTKPGTPWLNDLREKYQNLWQGKSKTIIIRSQDDMPIAIYAGNQVEIAATDVPKSTLYRIDGKYLFVYRANLTSCDNDICG